MESRTQHDLSDEELAKAKERLARAVRDYRQNEAPYELDADEWPEEEAEPTWQ